MFDDALKDEQDVRNVRARDEGSGGRAREGRAAEGRAADQATDKDEAKGRKAAVVDETEDKAKIETATLEAESRPSRAAEAGKSTLLAPPATSTPGTRGALIAAPAAAKTVDDDADGADGGQQNLDGATGARTTTVTPAVVRYGRGL